MIIEILNMKIFKLWYINLKIQINVQIAHLKDMKKLVKTIYKYVYNKIRVVILVQ